MPLTKQRIITRLLIFFTIAVVVVYLLACLVPFLNAGSFWWIAVLGLGFPFLLLLLLVFLLIWIFKWSRWVFLPLLALILSWQQLTAFFPFRVSKNFSTERSENSIRVMSWNVSRWDERNRATRSVPYRELMMDIIRENEADVLCLQEFFDCYDPQYFQANIPPLEKMGYVYHYFFKSAVLFEGRYNYGLLIASRYPILDSAGSLNGGKEHSEGFSYADIKIGNNIIRVFDSHLESVGFNKQDYQDLGEISSSRTVAQKLKSSYRLRSAQAENIRKAIAASPYPVILASDLDDVPNSYAYFTVKSDLQDAFLKKGSGLGRTFRFISPTLRIDYIFADRKLNVQQFTTLHPPYSDHYPVIADFTFK
jgi:endonuclease/exonuclease/phosphatase family metal-dependent hydrolase